MRRRILCGVCVCFGLLAGDVVRAGAQPKGGKLTWAWRTPVRPAVPRVKNHGWVKNSIDAFIAAAQEKEGLTPAACADRLTLIRRLTFDLTGLPPTPAEIDAFLKDAAADAYEKLVERLLASPRYGERWAMYWLDLVRFAESDGFKADDVRPTAWRYRDYVIKALNQDKPYDRFIREQIAGDELYAGDQDALVATAFNRHFPDEYNARNLEQRRQEILNDITDTTSQVFLGLTVGCARCHDHKYDPITQKDYYRLQAFFAAVFPRDEMPLGGAVQLKEYQDRQRAWETQTADLRRRMDTLEEPVLAKLVGREKIKYPREIQDAHDTPPDKRTPYQKQLADLVGKQLVVKTDLMTKAMAAPVRKEWTELAQKMAAFDKLKPRPLSATLGITDVGPVAPATFLLQRGDWRSKGDEVTPGIFALLDPKPAAIPARATDTRSASTTGRRAALAEWLTRPDNPLTARVMVNRLWQHHFGRGIVATASDFGVIGEAATHPELLDWLACEFTARGWSLKAIHRLMVTSATYRQSSAWREDAAKLDPENHVFWRMNRRRLEGESLRDAMLSISGLLNLKEAGPSVFPELPAEMKVPAAKWPVSADEGERQRRSVYVFVKRNLRYPLFAEFDAPDSNETCARRHVSTNAPQALMLLNGKITLDMARAFAARVLQGGSAPAGVVERVYRLALGRTPTARESALATAFLTRDTASFNAAVVDFCHVTMNLNEFAYVD